MKKLVLIILFFVSTSSFAQLSLSVYGDKAMALSVPVNKRIFSELRAYSNMYLKSMKLEPMVLVNFKRSRNANVYGGVGAVFVPNDVSYLRVSVPIGVQITPFKDFRNLAFVIEVAPEIYDEVYLRSTWGIRYIFMKQDF
ncbi:MAG: hypothetical protein WCK02_02365 [Bacteroidota bacterium]